MFWGLESRRLLSVTVTNNNGYVTITGTSGKDEVYVYGMNLYDGTNNLMNDHVLLNFYAITNLKGVTINGGGGNDRIEYDSGELLVPIWAYGENGNDTITAWKADFTYEDGGAGDDHLDNGFTLVGGDGNDVLDYGYTMNGGSGNDTLFGDVSEDSGRPLNQKIVGGDGNDLITGDGGVDTIDAGNGNDIVYTSLSGADEFSPELSTPSTIKTGTGSDKVYLASPAVVNLGPDDDRAYFDQSALYPYQSHYPLFGEVFGEGGKDWIQVKDNVTLSSSNQFKLHGGDGNDTIIGSKANDSLDGDSDNDLIYGNLGNDVINGGLGNDTLDGDAGNDKLYGGDGNDSLIGDLGKDSLYGQLGIDTLIAKDGEKDYLSGGASTDLYSIDTIDTVID